MDPIGRSVSMTRRASFSSGHRFWLDSRSEEENLSLFGPWASRFNHGHNYLLDVTVQGGVDPITGMVLNIKLVDDFLQSRVVSALDRRSLNDEVDGFRDRVPTLENLMLWLWDRIEVGSRADEGLRRVSLTHLRLEEMPTMFGELFSEDEKTVMTLSRVYEFCAAHRLQVPGLTFEENWELFGKCTNEAGHGHNYELEVTVRGDPDPATGMFVDIQKLDELVQELVVERYDHKNLNVDIEEFAQTNPTSEMLATAIFYRLKGKLPAELYRVRLRETPRSCFEVTANQ